MFTILLIILAAILNAVMDRTETIIAYNASVFFQYSQNFWCKPIAAHAVKLLSFTKYRVDAWHLSKSALVVCLCAAPLVYVPVLSLGSLPSWLVHLCLYGAVWNFTFNIFYNHLFKK